MLDKKIFIDRVNEISTKDGNEPSNKEKAEIMGCSPGQASKIMNYKNSMQPNIDNLINLADYYDVSIDWLVGLDTYRIPDKWYGSYADILRFIIGIVDLEDLQALSPEWTLDVDTKTNKSVMTCHDGPISNFFKVWIPEREKYKKGINDRHLYDLWVNDQLKFYSEQRPSHRHVEAVWNPDEPKPEPKSKAEQWEDHQKFVEKLKKSGDET